MLSAKSWPPKAHHRLGTGGPIIGFHILPRGVVVSPSSPVVLAAGAVVVSDQHGTLLAGTQVRLIPRKGPRSSDDTLEARVEVLDAAGTILTSVAQKTFFPQSWTEDQIQQAVYAAFVASYRRGAGSLGKIVGVTEQGVTLELRVQGTISAAGTRLTKIATAMPQPGQFLNVSHRP